MFVTEEFTIHEFDLVADELREIGVKAQAALLRMEKDAHQAARLIAEDAVTRGMNLAVDEFKSIHRLGFLALGQITKDGKT